MNMKRTSIIILLFAIASFTFGQTHKSPPMRGNMPNLISSGWSVIKLGLTGKPLEACADVIVFCKVSQFSYVPASGIGRQGSFKVQGNSLILISSTSDKTKSTYKMTWKAGENTLKLVGDGVVMELVYNGASTCSG